MGLRLACSWMVEEMTDRALWRISTPDERVAEAERNYEAAVAEVTEFLSVDPMAPSTTDDLDMTKLTFWMGGEVAA